MVESKFDEIHWLNYRPHSSPGKRHAEMQFQKTQRGAYLNFLRSKYEGLKGEIVVTATPYYMGIDPTSICQLRCPLCPTGVELENSKVSWQAVMAMVAAFASIWGIIGSIAAAMRHGQFSK